MREIKFRAWDGKKLWKVISFEFGDNDHFIEVYGIEPTLAFRGIINDDQIKFPMSDLYQVLFPLTESP